MNVRLLSLLVALIGLLLGPATSAQPVSYQGNAQDVDLLDSRSSASIYTGNRTVGIGFAGNPVVGMLHIKARSGIVGPNLFSEGGYDLAVPPDEGINFGHWDIDTFESRMRISPDGHVGIGTETPEASLHVYRPDGTGTDDIFKVSYDGALGLEFPAIRVGHDGTTLLNWAPSSWPSGYSTVIGSRVAIGSSSSPFPSSGYALAVDGSIISTEVVVKEDIGADFVFAEDYTLTPLDELEREIRTAQHLPGIPSAEEMIEEGVRVGELQIQLLQKVEELTLYVIEQHKQLRTLEAQNEALQSQLRTLNGR